MTGEERRENIRKILEKNEKAIKGTLLGKMFNVSRQVIVQDISILRAAGEDIFATPNGYMKFKNRGVKKSIVCRHSSTEAMKEELEIMVYYGVKVLDVIVEHEVYGEVKGNLNISSQEDVEEFIKKFSEYQSNPLSSLTDGIHLHTLEITDEKKFESMKKRLASKGYLFIQK